MHSPWLFSIVIVFCFEKSLGDVLEAIYHNKELNYDSVIDLNQDKTEVRFNRNEYKHVTYSSVHYENFALYMTLKYDSDNESISDESIKGLWVYLLQDSVDHSYEMTLNESEVMNNKYDGIALKVNRNSLIAVKNNGEIMNKFLFSEQNTKSDPHRYIYEINEKTKSAKGEIFIRISYYHNNLYYELSTDGINYNLWFVDQYLIKPKNKLHFEVIASLNNEKAGYAISHIFLTNFKGVIDKNKEVSEINGLHEKLESINKLMHKFDIYNEFASHIELFPFEKLINDSTAQIEKMSYINDILSKSLNKETPTIVTDKDELTQQFNQSQDLNTLMDLIRNVTLAKSSLDIDNSYNELLSSINFLKEKHHEMNESLNEMYKTVAESIQSINLKANKMEKYKFFEKVLLILVIGSFVLLFMIFRNISNPTTNNGKYQSTSINSSGCNKLEIA